MFKSSTPSKLAMILVSLVALFAVGCGDSREDYVFTGNPPASPNTGNLTFRFEQQGVAAQQAGVVPAGTASLQFEFYDSTSGNDTDLVFEDTVAYANQVTISGVPASAVFVRVTAYSAAGAPLAVFSGTFQVAVGATTPVDLSAPTAVTFDSLGVSPSTLALSLAEGGTDSAQLTLVGNFSNGQSVAFPLGNTTSNVEFSSSDESVATVSDRGLVEAVGNGVANITTTYTLNGVEREAVTTVSVTGGIVAIDTLSVTPSTLTIAEGTQSGPLTAVFTPAGGTAVDVTGNVTYTLQAPVAGIEVDNQTGVVTVESETSNTTTAVVVASYTTGNTTVTDTVDVRVGDVFVVSVGAAGGNTLRFPAETVLPPTFVVTLSDGTSQPGFGFSLVRSAKYGYEVEVSSISNPEVLNVTEDGRLQFLGDDGDSATFTLTERSSNVSATITAVVTSDTTYTIDLQPSKTQVDEGDFFRVRALMNYGGGIVQDITPFVDLSWETINGLYVESVDYVLFPGAYVGYTEGMTGTVNFNGYQFSGLVPPTGPTAFNGTTVTVIPVPGDAK